jgi:hypothetical protein
MLAIVVFSVTREYLVWCLWLMVLVIENKSWPQEICHVKMLVPSDLCVFVYFIQFFSVMVVVMLS